MTGVVENNTRIAGVDRDSIVRQADGPTRATLFSFSALRDGTTTATGDFDVDCTKHRYQQIKVSIVHGDGRRATILSRGPDWDTPANATDAALFTATCSLDFSGLSDIRNSDPERYAAEQMKDLTDIRDLRSGLSHNAPAPATLLSVSNKALSRWRCCRLTIHEK